MPSRSISCEGCKRPRSRPHRRHYIFLPSVSRLFLKHREARVAKEDNVPYVNGIKGVLAFGNEIALSVSSSVSR
ncbi:hypothetical protein HZ326_2691 [Fusarium oxysporum f. sp. albedinis]|nr:hypothetical protein HZ326_2691 [Fusarium oxysporum f. sp. albedinis]